MYVHIDANTCIHAHTDYAQVRYSNRDAGIIPKPTYTGTSTTSNESHNDRHYVLRSN